MPIMNLDVAQEKASEFDKYRSDPLALYKHCQSDRKSVSEYMETLDPTGINEDGTPAQELDAFERHLMVRDIQLHGAGQWTVERLGAEAEYLMPELVLREVKAGMDVKDQFSYADCVAQVVPSKSATYHPLYIPDLDTATAVQRRRKALGERAASAKGGEFPTVSIRRREKDIVAIDLGRVVEASYATIRDYGWQDFAVFLRLIGAQLAADKLQNVYDLAITGDGTVGAATDTFNGTAGTLAYTDLIRNYTMYASPYVMSRVLAPQQSTETILAMAQFTDPLSGWKFQRTGEMVTPMGAKLKQVSDTAGNAPVGTEIATLDHRFAVKEVVNQPLSVEADKIINRKFEQAVISEVSRLCIIADGALKRIVWT